MKFMLECVADLLVAGTSLPPHFFHLQKVQPPAGLLLGYPRIAVFHVRWFGPSLPGKLSCFRPTTRPIGQNAGMCGAGCGIDPAGTLRRGCWGLVCKLATIPA